MLKKVLIALGIVIGSLGLVIAMQPATYHVERSVSIAAAPEIIFPLVNDMHQWTTWSPWEKRDPTMQKSFSGPEAGVGATYHWIGNKDVGEGEMVVAESRAPEFVKYDLSFIKPWKSTSTSTFNLTREAEGTTLVTWGMDGSHTFMSKACALFSNMDKMVGKDFEEGLAALKTSAEAEAQKAQAAAAAAAAAQAAPAPAADGTAAPAAPAPEGAPAAAPAPAAPAAK